MKSPAACRSVSAEKVVSARPCVSQNSSSPGSSFLMSMLAAPQTASRGTPAASNTSCTADPILSASVPLRQPMPAYTMRGTRCRVCANGAAFVSNPITKPLSASASRLMCAGSRPSTGKSDRTPTVSPRSSAPDTYLMCGGSSTAQPLSLAQLSTANTSRPSVAVVTTACAPRPSASRSASAFAPPRCPDSTGITNLPASSITMTAGSYALPAR